MTIIRWFLCATLLAFTSASIADHRLQREAYQLERAAFDYAAVADQRQRHAAQQFAAGSADFARALRHGSAGRRIWASFRDLERCFEQLERRGYESRRYYRHGRDRSLDRVADALSNVRRALYLERRELALYHDRDGRDGRERGWRHEARDDHRRPNVFGSR